MHDTQLLLSLSGFYTGHLDGRCGPHTEQAINAYVGTLSQKPTGTVCSTTFIIPLLDTLLSSVERAIHPINDNSTISLLSSKLDSITADMNNEKSDINKLKSDNDTIVSDNAKSNAIMSVIRDNIATNFTNGYSSLINNGIVATLTLMSIIVASIASSYIFR
jgi:hypothetical protein